MYQGVFTDFAWKIDQNYFGKTSHTTLIMNVTTGEVDDNGGGSSTTGRGGGLVSSGCRRARAPLPGPGPPGPRQTLIDGSVSVRLSGTSRRSLRLTH